MIFYPPLPVCLQGRVCGVAAFAGFAGRLAPRCLTEQPYRATLLGSLVAALLFTLLLAASRTHTQRAGRLHRQQQEQTRHHND